MTQFIAYYRVSTQEQGKSGLGLDAQRHAVAQHIGNNELIAEYTEVESGKQSKNRPQLIAAMNECKTKKATLVIAKLDRLSRNVAFIAALVESKLDFICCDNPHATKLMLHMLAAFAEHERDQIAARTKASFEVIKRDLALNGSRVGKISKRVYTRLGNPDMTTAHTAARQHYIRKRPAPEIIALIQSWRAQSWTFQRISDEMNRLGIKPPRGKQWYPSSARNQIMTAN